MEETIQWRGFFWTIVLDGKCPECGKATLCWRHLYMAEKYVNVLQGLDGGVSWVKDTNNLEKK